MGLAKNKMLRKIFFTVNGKISTVSPLLSSHLAYFFARKKILHLNPPQDLNEKFMWLKLNIYNYHPVVCQCADKLAMRTYVEKKGCPEILSKIHKVWKSVDEIDFSSLPEKFVLKCNHGSGFNLICRDRDSLDIEKTRVLLRQWMKTDYWRRSAELNYKNVPRRIFCEEYMETKSGSLPDYKVMCYYGEPQYILYCDGRDSQVQKLSFTVDWQLTPYNKIKTERKIEKPESLDKMLYYARVLSKDFPAVRMDFYDCDGVPVLGEMTFTPAGCVGMTLSEDGLKYYGNCLDLSHETVIKMQNEVKMIRNR